MWRFRTVEHLCHCRIFIITNLRYSSNNSISENIGKCFRLIWNMQKSHISCINYLKQYLLYGCRDIEKCIPLTFLKERCNFLKLWWLLWNRLRYWYKTFTYSIFTWKDFQNLCQENVVYFLPSLENWRQMYMDEEDMMHLLFLTYDILDDC